MQDRELIEALYRLEGKSINLTYDSCNPVPGTNGCQLLSVRGILLRCTKTFVVLQGLDKRELYLPIEYIYYFSNLTMVEEQLPTKVKQATSQAVPPS